MSLRSASLTPVVDPDSIFANINIFASGETVYALDFRFFLSLSSSVGPSFVKALTCCSNHLNFGLTVETTRLRNRLPVRNPKFRRSKALLTDGLRAFGPTQLEEVVDEREAVNGDDWTKVGQNEGRCNRR